MAHCLWTLSEILGLEGAWMPGFHHPSAAHTPADMGLPGHSITNPPAPLSKPFLTPPSTCPRAAIFPTFWPNCPPTLLPLAAVTLGDPSDLPSPLCPTAATVPAGWLQVGAVVSALLLCNARQLLQPQGSAPPGSPRPSSITCRPGP